MRAGERACACPECGVVCTGQFDGCPEVWALTAGVDPPPAPPAGTNGHANASAPPPPPPPHQPSASRTEVLQWFEDAFDEVRNELHAVASSVTRQQAMLAELLDSREAELRVVMVAESLPELAGEAAAKALTDQSDGLAETVAASLEEFQESVAASELSNAAVMDGMRELLRRIELTAELNAEAAHQDAMARLEALKASMARQVKPVAAAVAELAAWVEATEEREAARTRALKASVSRQIAPLAAAVEAALARSDHQISEIRARLDALGAPKVRRVKAGPSTRPKRDA